ncbi:MAG TPA: glycosyltransferase family 39 protein, partial [Chloroflexota bacterium]|nr:glycosyltransferase family 39 protein [Chloroflexota bacterium]
MRPARDRIVDTTPTAKRATDLKPRSGVEHTSTDVGGVSKWHHGLLFLIIAFALLIRLWRLDAVPAGLSHDEAYDALNAVDIMRGERPVFFDSNNGREALFMYMVAASFSILGVGPFQLRLVSALAGVAAIALLYLFTRRLFGCQAGLVAAAFMAVSFWPLFESRVGLRASLLPALVTLLAYGLWRWQQAAFERRHGPAVAWAVVAGLALGTSLHTYTVARMLPLIPITFAIFIAGTRIIPWRRALSGLAVMSLSTLIIFAPLMSYFVAHPGSFSGRTGQVNDLRFILEDGNFGPLIEDTLNTFGMFAIRGDPFMRYNLADRPVFDPLTSVLFYLGLLVTLGTLRLVFSHASADRASQTNGALAGLENSVAWTSPGNGYSRRRSTAWNTWNRLPILNRGHLLNEQSGVAAALVLIWLAVGLLPSATTGESPHFLRAIGAQPAVFILPSLGLMLCWQWLTNSDVRQLWLQRSGLISVVIAALLIALTSILTVRDYFVVWNGDAESRHIYGAPFAAVSRLIESPSAERTFMASEYPADIDRFVLDVQRGLEPNDLSWFDGRRALVFPATGPARYLFPRNARPPDDLIDRFFPDAVMADDPELLSVRLSSPPQALPSRPHEAQLGNYLNLVGYDLPSDVESGGRLRLTMYWRVLDRPPEDISLFVHLVGPLGSLWGQQDGMGLPRDQWQRGDLLVEWHDVDIPVGTPPADFQLEAGGYFQASGERIELRTGSTSSDRLHLGSIAVTRPLDVRPIDHL